MGEKNKGYEKGNFSMNDSSKIEEFSKKNSSEEDSSMESSQDKLKKQILDEKALIEQIHLASNLNENKKLKEHFPVRNRKFINDKQNEININAAIRYGNSNEEK